MRQIDQQIEVLESLHVAQTRQPDFDAFWDGTRARCADVPLNVRGGLADYPVAGMDVQDLTYDGLDGTPIHAWVVLPAAAARKGKVPVIVHYHGAGGSRGEAFEFAHWVLAGCAVVSVDFRMQRGDTGSSTGFDGNIQNGWWTLGIRDLLTSYVYMTWTDCLRAIRLARETHGIDVSRIAVEGVSQGGGMALGMAALDRTVALCMADVPSNCNMDERIFQRAGGGSGIADYLNAHPDRIDEVSRHLSYFDNINHAPQIACPVLASCGLKDPVCPPSCVYAAYNKITAPREMVCYPFAGHEGGRTVHELRKLAFVRGIFFGGER